MKIFKSWCKEHLKNKKFVLSLFVSVIIWVGLTVEFCAFEYAPLKIIRYLLLLISMFLIAWIDGEHHKIPNKILFFLLLCRSVLLMVECFVYVPVMFTFLISAFLGILTGAIMLGTCYLISRGGVGAGDVKLFMVIGYFMGTNGVVATAFLAVCMAALYSIVLWLGHKITLKQTIPFGPFVYIGMILAYFLGV